MLAALLLTLGALIGPLVTPARCMAPEVEHCLEAMAQTYTQVPLRCAPASTSFHDDAAGEYYDSNWEPLTGLPEEVVIYYTAVQGLEDPASVVLYHRTVLAHELGHSWWMTHATDAQRAQAQRVLGWSTFDEEAAADTFAMAATAEWRPYWGSWSDRHPEVPEPTQEALEALDALDLVPELGGTFASFAEPIWPNPLDA